MYRIGIVLAISLVPFLTGCVTRFESKVAPDVKLADYESYFVEKLAADGRGVEKIIAAELLAQGKSAGYGVSAPSDGADVILRYADKWQRDITMYMIGLTIKFHDPATDALLAVGKSYRTSQARKTPGEMVHQVIDGIFGRQDGRNTVGTPTCQDNQLNFKELRYFRLSGQPSIQCFRDI